MTASLDALPEVVAAAGDRCEIYLDGGVRRGTDVLKALALGGSDEGAPGERAPKFYMSYFRDLDGNKLCAFNLG